MLNIFIYFLLFFNKNIYEFFFFLVDTRIIFGGGQKIEVPPLLFAVSIDSSDRILYI